MAMASFEQGGIVKANLHEGEMVLPKHLSSFVQSAALSASGKSPNVPAGQRPIIFQYHSHASARESEGIGDVLAQHGDAMFAFFRGKLRKMGHNV